MINLVIDRGNTRIKWGLFEKDKLVSTHHSLEVTDAVVHEVIGTATISNCIISGSGDITGIKEILSARQIPFIMVFDDVRDTEINIDYDTPHTLGRDRIASVIGARSLKPDFHSLVINLGTCITYDLIDASGTYQGGSIHPGMQIRYKSMHDYTHSLPQLSKPDAISNVFIGKSTSACMHIGVVKAIALEINAMIDLYQQKFTELSIFITGGDSEYFVEQVNCEIFATPFLVLRGLNQILQHNA